MPKTKKYWKKNSFHIRSRLNRIVSWKVVKILPKANTLITMGLFCFFFEVFACNKREEKDSHLLTCNDECFSSFWYFANWAPLEYNFSSFPSFSSIFFPSFYLGLLFSPLYQKWQAQCWRTHNQQNKTATQKRNWKSFERFACYRKCELHYCRILFAKHRLWQSAFAHIEHHFFNGRKEKKTENTTEELNRRKKNPTIQQYSWKRFGSVVVFVCKVHVSLEIFDFIYKQTRALFIRS